MSDHAMEVQERWNESEGRDRKNREEAVEDSKFAAGEQWDERVREYRENGDRDFPLPCLTINTLPQFIGQVVGDRRANETSIKVLPREDGDKKVAEVRSELIRSIEHQSKANRVYASSFEQAVTCGIGNFRIDMDYAYEDAFERDLFVNAIPNPLAVLWDDAADPTGRDAQHCFVIDKMTTEAFKREYKEAVAPTMFDPKTMDNGWYQDDRIRVAEYWTMGERDREIALFANGETKDITDMDMEEVKPQLWRDANGEPRMRKAACRYATMVMTNGHEELSDPYELKIPRIPIIRVMGREIWVEDRRVRFGLSRFARDPQRLKNYWRSVVAELLMGAPRANYIASASAIKGREQDWPNTLVHNDSGPKPEAITTQNLAAFVNEAAMCSQDMKDVTGLHDASMGMRGNETSGVAIQRRQHEGDIATIGYHDNMNAAMQEAGEVLNALIPVVYDTPRTIRVIGDDDAVRLLRVNDPDFTPTELVKENFDLSKGRYDVAISTGPSYMTKRQEASTQLMELARGNQGMMEKAGDLIMKSLDIPQGDELAERLKPQGAMSGEDMTPEEMAQAQQQQQMAQMQMQMEMQSAQAELQKQMAEAQEAVAQASEAEFKVKLAELELMNKQKEMALEGADLVSAAEV